MPSAKALKRSRPSPAGHGWTAQRSAWLLFAPPAFLVAVRWLLQLVDDRQSAAPALLLAPVSSTAGALELLWPAALALALLVAAGLVIRRLGWQRVMPGVGAAWLFLWLAGSGALVARHLNRQHLFLQELATSGAAPAQVKARVLAAQPRPASLRSLGGTELVLQVGGLTVPQRLLIGEAGAALLQPGDMLALQLAPGRFGGLFVTGWQAPPPTDPLAKIP
ncbi:MAG: hypothetical protein H7273_06205 [Polaromonas sp.]|nr:hypothetical protein [Polaromonas sp.]